jgi:hypothetical protein
MLGATVSSSSLLFAQGKLGVSVGGLRIVGPAS